MRRAIFAAFLPLIAVCAFAGEPTVGPDRALSQPPFGEIAGGKNYAKVATNGDDFLVVWDDLRTGGAGTVFAVRIDGSGEVLDELPIVVGHPRAYSSSSVRWDGDAWVVGTIYSLDAGGYVGARITTDGQVSRVAADSSETRRWPRNDAGETIEVVRQNDVRQLVRFIDAQGNRGTLVEVNASGSPAAVEPLGGDEWVVVFTSVTGGAYWVRLNKAGVIESKWLVQLNLATGERAAISVAARGRSAAAIWTTSKKLNPQQNLDRWQRTVRWAVMEEGGATYSGERETDVVMQQASLGLEPTIPHMAVTADGTAFQFAYTRFVRFDMELHAFRVIAGEVTDTLLDGPRRRTYGEAQYEPVLASGARNLLVWTQPCGIKVSPCQLATRVFDRGATAADAATVNLADEAPAYQRDPSAASGRLGALTVWQESEDDVAIAARFWPHYGAPSAVLDVSSRFAYDTLVLDPPRVAATANGFAVVWGEGDIVLDEASWVRGDSRLMLRRFDAAGKPLDAAPVNLGKDYLSDYSIAPLGNDFLFAWIGNYLVRTMTIPLTGGAGPVMTVTPGTFTTYRVNVQALATGDHVTLIWSESERSGGQDFIVWYAATVSASGTAGERVSLVRSRPENFFPSSIFAAAASNREILLAWPNPAGTCISYRIFDFALNGISNIEQLACGEAPSGIAVGNIWDGERWWVVPQRQGTIFSSYGYAVERNGTLGTVLPIVPSGIAASAPSLARVPQGVLVLYSRADDTAPFVSRAFMRTLTELRRARAVRH